MKIVSFFGDVCDEYGEFFSDGLSGRSSVTQKICTYHAVEGAIGVNYGRVADKLPQPTVVANLVQRLGIKNVKIFDTDATVLSAFANTGISIIVGVPNNQIVSLAGSSSAARTWVQTNVKNFFPATQITYIVVGNEVLSGDSSIWPSLVPAMQQIYSALRFYSLDTNIKVSTPHSMGVLVPSFPPSVGVFHPNIATSIMAPLLSFLSSTQSPFMINAYPYFAYLGDRGQNIALNYALIEPGAVGITDPNSGLHYSSLIDAMLDTTIYAMKALNFNNIPLIVTESGWPSKGDPNEIGASVANAEIYNNNLVRHVTVAQPLGTPLRPGVEIDTYIFALFNEDLKPGATSERNFGLYNPDLTQVYPINLNPTSSQFSTNLALS
jgi:exo-beta-1,3-glucanase (GH17 family)